MENIVKNNSCFVLVKEGFRFDVVVKITITHEFSYNVESCFGLEFVNKCDDIGVMDEFQNSDLLTDDLLFGKRKFEFFYHFDGDFKVGCFLLVAFVDDREFACAYFLGYHV